MQLKLQAPPHIDNISYLGVNLPYDEERCVMADNPEMAQLLTDFGFTPKGAAIEEPSDSDALKAQVEAAEAQRKVEAEKAAGIVPRRTPKNAKVAVVKEAAEEASDEAPQKVA